MGGQEIWRERAGTGDPNWLKRYSMLHNIMFDNKNRRKFFESTYCLETCWASVCRWWFLRHLCFSHLSQKVLPCQLQLESRQISRTSPSYLCKDHITYMLNVSFPVSIIKHQLIQESKPLMKVKFNPYWLISKEK